MMCSAEVCHVAAWHVEPSLRGLYVCSCIVIIKHQVIGYHSANIPVCRTICKQNNKETEKIVTCKALTPLFSTGIMSDIDDVGCSNQDNNSHL